MKFFTSSLLLLCIFCSSAQDVDIVKIVDALTIKWDKRASDLETYMGMKYYCTADKYRNETIDLLDDIHHYDTLLYGIVTRKYADTKDKEAEATLKDIIELEAEYTTANFKAFLSEECEKFAEIEEKRNEGGSYAKDVEKLEKELVKYVGSITQRIDLIDEHIHHLDLD